MKCWISSFHDTNPFKPYVPISKPAIKTKTSGAIKYRELKGERVGFIEGEGDAVKIFTEYIQRYIFPLLDSRILPIKEPLELFSTDWVRIINIDRKTSFLRQIEPGWFHYHFGGTPKDSLIVLPKYPSTDKTVLHNINHIEERIYFITTPSTTLFERSWRLLSSQLKGLTPFKRLFDFYRLHFLREFFLTKESFNPVKDPRTVTLINIIFLISLIFITNVRTYLARTSNKL